MGIRPSDFENLTPAEFIYAWIGWQNLENDRQKMAWERQRWAVWINTTVQLEPKDRKSMTEMFPLAWDEKHEEHRELTIAERRAIANKMIKGL